MAQTFQPTQYQPITAYDMPGVMFQQLLDDELTFTSIKHTMFQSHRLSPDERVSFADNLKAQVGSRSAMTDAFVDIATNPWVWLAFLTTPGVPSTIGKAGRTVWEGSKFGAFVREQTPWLMSMGLWSPNHVFHNSAIGDALLRASDSLRGFKAEMGGRTSGIEKAVVQHLREQGIRVGSLNALRESPKYRGVLQEIDMAMFGYLNRMGRDSTHWIPHAKAEYRVERYTRAPEVTIPGVGTTPTSEWKLVSTKTGPLSRSQHANLIKQQAETTANPEALEKVYVIPTKTAGEAGVVGVSQDIPRLMNQAKIDEVIGKYGLQPLLDAHTRNLDEIFIKNFGMDDLLSQHGNNASEVMRVYREGRITIEELIDPNKVTRIWRSAANDALSETFLDPGMKASEAITMTAGKRMISEFFDITPQQMDNVTESQFRDNINKVFEIHLKNEQYFPFGLREHIDELGQSVYKGNALEAKQQRAAVASGMNLPRVRHPNSHIYHPDDIQMFRGMAEGDPVAMENVEILQRNLDNELGNLKPGRALSVRRANANRSLHLYTDRAAETYALHVAGAKSRRLADGTVEVVYDRSYWDNITSAQRVQATELQRTASGQRRAEEALYDIEEFGSARLGDTFMDIPAANQAPGGFSLGDVLNQGYKGMDGNSQQFGRALLKDTVIPRFMGRRTVAEMSTFGLSSLVKHTARSFAEGPIGQAIAKSHPSAKRFVQEIEEMGKPHSVFSSPRLASGQAAKYLYVTHLGANMASVLLNLTQPWMHTASWVGVRSVLAGYREASKELFGYLENRAKMGKLILSDAEKVDLIGRSFKHAKDDLLGIGPDMYSLVDDVTNYGVRGQKSKTEAVFMDMPMKLFEKAEWMNRLVTAHAVDDMFKKAGRYTDDVTSADYGIRTTAVRAMVDETQFGGTVMNTPSVFLGKGFLGQMGDSPLIRQFLTFPLRTVTATFPGIGHVSQALGGGKRVIRGLGEFDMGPFSTLYDFTRAMGIAGVLYYTGKNFLGVDPSRGLIANASTDLFGGQQFLEGGEYDWFPVPPAIDMIAQSTRGILSGDMDILRRTLPRFVPSGVALSRAMSIQPENMGLGQNIFGDLAGLMQKNYVDYGNPTPEGYVPFYKGDGTFVDFRHPGELIFQGLGMDMGRSKLKGELDGYLVSQREEILNYRNEFLNALFSNNVSKAMGVKAEFEKRFKIPMTITKENLRSRMRNRNVSRTERIADRLPPEARGKYLQYMAARGPEMGIDPAAFTGETPTSLSRNKEFDRPQNYDLDPETIKVLKQMVEEAGREKPLKTRSFTESYAPFDWRQ